MTKPTSWLRAKEGKKLQKETKFGEVAGGRFLKSRLRDLFHHHFFFGLETIKLKSTLKISGSTLYFYCF